ncbi:MAG: aldo/keto reductase [Myxococcota bacterium]
MADRNDAPERTPQLDRRDFLRVGAAATVGVGLLGSGAAAEPPKAAGFRTLGRTGLRISDISFGSGFCRGPRVVRHAFDRGINYFDTAESYPLGAAGQAERAIGQALAGRRDQVILATKTEARADQKQADFMAALEASLRRLRTDHADVYFNHAVNDLERLRNPEWHAFVAKAKEQGKIRFSGMSGHAGHLVPCLDAAIDEDLVDVILVAHNFGQDPAFYEKFTKGFDLVAIQPELPRVIDKAHAKGIGVIAMKTLMGAKLNDMTPFTRPGDDVAHAAFRWVLSNPKVSGLVVSMKGPRMVDHYLRASGQAPRASDSAALRGYLLAHGGTQCRLGCGACNDACPAGVPISDVLRTRMYARRYGEPDAARSEYARLGSGAAPCLSCAAPSCVAACPHDLPVADLTRQTAALLGPKA